MTAKLPHPTLPITLIGILAVGAAAGAQSRAHEARRRTPPAPTSTRWIGASPRVPLAEVRVNDPDPQRFDFPENACRAWAVVNSTWNAIDKWGQLVGPAHLISRDYYEVSDCYENTFDLDSPLPPQESLSDWHSQHAVLYAQGAFTPSPSVEWTPTAQVRAEHARFLESLDRLILDTSAEPNTHGQPIAQPVPVETMFFRFTERPMPDNERPVAVREFAASGGRSFVIAERVASGAWRIAHLNIAAAVSRIHVVDAYRPVAVFDMNADGYPEVVLHFRESSGEWFGDFIVSMNARASWLHVGGGVGGSTA